MGQFKRGFKPLAKEAKRQEEERKARSQRLYEFYLKGDKDEADVRFLVEEPFNVRVHQVKNAQGRYATYICTEDSNCPYCNQGDNPSIKGASLVLDKRPYQYTDDKGKKKTNKDGQVRLFLQGTKVMGQLERISEKYGLTDRDVTIIRLGTGTSTSYTIERGDEYDMEEDEILKALPEWCREKFDGSEESLYDILEEQLEKMRAKPEDDEDGDYDDDEDEDNEDDEDERPSRKSSRKSSKKSKKYLDDDDEDDDYDEVEDDEDDEDDEPPKKLSRKSKFKRRR